jgi:polyhydroxyalkanoate synthesis repressor PhaR
MVRSERDFVVYDAKTGDDLTHSVLTQIIVDQESRSGGPTLLPTPFLRQLIRFYDDSMSRMVPGYLQFSLESLARDQDRFRQKFTDAWGSVTGLEALQEQARHNLQVFEQAMAMWSPYRMAQAAGPSGEEAAHAGTEAATPSGEGDVQGQSEPPPERNEIDALKAELEAMQKRIEKLSQSSRS